VKITVAIFQTMSQTCDITSCKRPSCALCHCCQQNVCLPHLKEHQDALISQLNPFVDQINALGDRLKALNTERMIGNCRQKLEQWRAECHLKIDHFFEQKCQELDQSVAEQLNKQRKEIDRIQAQLGELIREEYSTRRDLDLLTSNIGNLEREMNKIEQASFNAKIQSLEIDDNWIRIEDSNVHQLDLSTLPAVNKTIQYTVGSSKALASNDRLLLMHQKPNLCLLDRNLTVVKHALWNHNNIHDMCWSSVLDRFIVIDENNVFLFDQNTMSIEIFPSIQNQKWLRGACSDTSLYLLTYELPSSIIEYRLLPSIQLTRHWKSPDTCEKNEIINHMRYNNETLALIITKPLKRTACIELRTSKTFERLWSLQLDVEKSQKLIFTCCILTEDEWLVTDYGVGRILQITKQGKVKSTCRYQPQPLYTTMFNPRMLLVSTDNGLNLHKLQ
jgi:hypothetical protein